MIGGTVLPQKPTPHLHEARVRYIKDANGRWVFAVEIRLFAKLGAPTYDVVVGADI